ncbi:MAG TPA: LLM class flavin-dependent oxidoreductase [Streptosporangiaceae bacterium]|nr:LLM class flavin-dependent oxidoreductase [Streptosporangiaceae bacterium]
MRWSICIPQFVDDDGAFDPEALRGYIVRAEAAGFESAWTVEQVIGPASILSPLETMTYAAACVERIRLGCAVLVTPLHNPVHLAKSLGSLDQLSRGRLDVGVAIGGGGRMFSAFGVDPDDGLVARFNEGLRLMKALWTEPKVTFDGRFWQLDGAVMEPKPVQRPHPPIWFGGRAPAAVRRAVRHGDGFFGAGSTTTADFADQVALVRRELDEQGRDSGGFGIAKRVYLAVDDDAERARGQVAAGLVRLYGDFGRTLEPVAVAGTPDDCARGLRAVADAGAEMILLHPLSDQAAQMERLLAEVMPAVP